MKASKAFGGRLLPCILAVLAISLVLGCTTKGRFVIPDGTRLELHGRTAEVGPDGWVKRRPFAWSSAGIPPRGGIRYRLLRDGQVVQEGRLRSKFRTAAIFWPPFAGILAWPIGMNPNITYDLVNGKQQ